MKKTLSIVLVILITIQVFCCIQMTEKSNEISSSLSSSSSFTEKEYEEKDNIVTKVPSVSAKSCVLMDSKTGEILYGKNEDERLPMASTTKIMTAIIAIENLKLDDTAKIRFEDINVEGSNLYIKENDKITIKDLLYGLLLESGNDCANVLAYNTFNGNKEFADAMNKKAKELGLLNTSYENPSGLDGKNHFSTAEDLSKLMVYAMKNPIFRDIVSCEKMTLQNGRCIKNHNKLLKMTDYCTGGKTGFTKKAGRCLVSSGKYKDREYIVVTLNAPSDWDDHIKLYEYAFLNFSPVVLCSDESIELDVVGGTKDKVLVKNDRNVEAKNIEIKNGYEKRIILPKFVYAPLKKGDVVGKIEFYNDEKIIDSCELIASCDIHRERDSLWNKIKRGFFN